MKVIRDSFRFLILILFFNSYMIGCVEGNKPKLANYLASVQSLGRYQYDNGEVLTITNEANQIKLRLVNSNGEELIQFSSRASIFHRWLVFWNGEELVFASSDIGVYIMRDMPGLGYQVESLTEGHLKIIQSLPKDFSRYLNHWRN